MTRRNPDSDAALVVAVILAANVLALVLIVKGLTLLAHAIAGAVAGGAP